jgi:hypothetical protein
MMLPSRWSAWNLATVLCWMGHLEVGGEVAPEGLVGLAVAVEALVGLQV